MRFKVIKMLIATFLLIVLYFVYTDYRKQRMSEIKKLYITNTRSNRPVVYTVDSTGKVELVNARDLLLLEELKKLYEVVIKWAILY